jgi:beta-1,2-mannobiose phosphorylase / 1,2-beta-oligomannan phosphorylase
MLQVNKLGILLEKTENLFECEGVLNPAVIEANKHIHLFYRAVTHDNYSTIGYCRLSAPTVVARRNDAPLLRPEFDYEFQGLEDPRIVKIEGLFYMTYTAYNGENALGALATSTDLVHWEKQGILVPQVTYEEFQHFVDLKGKGHEQYVRFNAYQHGKGRHDRTALLWVKNLVFFPRKINGKFCFLHRIRPDVQIVVEVESLTELTVAFWQNYFLDFDKYVVLQPRFNHELSYIGSGCPPIETEAGWLLIYHGVCDSVKGYVYSACAALLDLNDPKKELARLPYPLFSPEKSWELKGEVDNVCFPTGALVKNDMLYVYYGAADERIAVASMSLKDLISEVLINPSK